MLRTVMYQSAEACPEPSQASTINAFVRIVNVFRWTLLTIFAKSIFASELLNQLNVSQFMSVYKVVLTP